MDIIAAREYCLSLPHTEESFPFDNQTLVLKVGGKMYALIALDDEPAVALKCDPELAITLRERYPAVQPGYHLSKKHWNTVLLNNTVSDDKIEEWIQMSFQLVVAGLPKKVKEQLTTIL
jgi:predicted DNA-binding protein (MmcQ/YjbR family)